jgi:hypothetical protein
MRDADSVCAFSKHEPGIPPYCPIALLRPGYLARGTRYRIDAESRAPNPVPDTQCHGGQMQKTG